MRSGYRAAIRRTLGSFAISCLTFLSLSVSHVYAAHENGMASVPRVIVVDPGHGGVDGGAASGGLLEKNITLDIGLRVRELLLRGGFQVRMTRDHDTDVSSLYPSALPSRHKRDLQNRLDLIRESRSVGSVSIHVNSSVNPHDRGPLVFYTVGSAGSQALAERMQQEVDRVSGSTQRAVGRKNLFIIRHAPCPAVLIEVGFLTNAHDQVRLRDPAYRQRMADAIAGSAMSVLRNAPVPPPYVKHSAFTDWLPPGQQGSA